MRVCRVIYTDRQIVSYIRAGPDVFSCGEKRAN